MHRFATRFCSPRHRGQSLVELLVVMTIVVGIFTLPHGGHSSLFALFTDAVGTGYGRFLSALALPL